MAIRYAKNPAELVIMNPTRRKMKRKRNAKGEFVSTKSRRKNPESKSKRSRAAKKGWEHRRHDSRRNPAFEPGKHIAAGILAFEGMRVVKYLVGKYGEKLSDHIKTGINIGVPAAAALATGLKGNSSFTAGLTTGFIISAANETLDVIPKVNDYLGDDGPVYLADGNMLTNGNQAVAQLAPPTMPAANAQAQYLGDSWENGETWEP